MAVNGVQKLKNVADYVVLPIQLKSAVHNGAKSSEHLLYIRPHEPKIPDFSSERSLFVANIPIDSTDAHFKSLFGTRLGAGRVERIQYESLQYTKAAGKVRNSKKRKRAEVDVNEEIPTGLPNTWSRTIHHSGSTAVVIFVDRSGMELSWKAVKKASKQKARLDWGIDSEQKVPELGSQRYFAHHTASFPSHDQLQKIVDRYMTAFEAQEDARAKALAKKRNVPDEDGFITVTRGGRTGPARQQAAQEKMEELKRKAEEKRKGRTDFYAFQEREKKKQAAQELVRKFEADREKVEQLSKRRKGRFTPM